MKTPDEIYIDEVHSVHESLGEKAAKLYMSEPIRKFVLNCLIKSERQTKQEFENFYKELQGRMKFLESEEMSKMDLTKIRVNELQLAIVRIQQILLEKIK